MKKNAYISPDIRNMACESHELIMGSTDLLGQENETSFTIKVTNEEAEGDFQSRRGNWFDED